MDSRDLKLQSRRDIYPDGVSFYIPHDGVGKLGCIGDIAG